jgi:hypothetical protein
MRPESQLANNWLGIAQLSKSSRWRNYSSRNLQSLSDKTSDKDLKISVLALIPARTRSRD